MNIATSPAPEVIALRRRYVSRQGAPVIDRVAVEIFQLRYFTHCMSCTFCKDWCCSHGVDIDLENARRLLAHKSELETRVGVAAEHWFTDEPPDEHEDYPGGACLRTSTRDGKCVFLNRKGRGCHLHAFALEKGLDYHDLKPVLSTLFPLTFDDGVLHVMDEVEDRELVCLGEGPTLYRGVRAELAYYFGTAFVEELDEIEAAHTRSPEAPPLAYRDRISMADWPAIRALVLKTGVFNEREVEGVRELIDDTVNRPAWGNYRFWIAEADGVIAGFTCVSPIHGTPDRYDMYWLAVDPDFHGTGCALALVDLAIDGIRTQGGRKLYVETSTRPSYEKARKFYLRAGFVLEGTLPDYYADGDGKAIFAKRI